MSSDVTIRELQPGDVDRLVEIAMAAWAPIYAHRRGLMGEALYDLTHPSALPDKEEQIRGACHHPESVLVAELEGTVVGFVTFYVRDARIGEIGNNAMDPAYRGRGIAGRLYEAALGRFRAAGLRYVKVSTGLDDAHTPARRAYEKAGFTIAVPTVTYWREL